MRQNGSVVWVLLLVLFLFGVAAWFVFLPDNGPEIDPAGLPEVEDSEPAPAELDPAGSDLAPPGPIAEAEAPEPESREELRVVPEGSILVRVLGPNDTPLEHVAVVVGMQRPGERKGMRLGSAHSDADGYAVVALDHEYRRRLAPFPPNPELLIDARFASSERVRVAKLLDDANHSETLLRLPETRLIEAIVTLPDGGAVDFPVSMSADWAPAGTPSDSDLWRKRRSETLQVEGDRGYLVAGFEMDVQLHCFDSTQRHARGFARVAGPSQGDPAIVQREVALGELVPKLRARLLNEAGEPMTGERVSLYQTLVRRPTVEFPNPDTTPDTKWVKNFDVGEDGWVELEYYINDYTRRYDRSWSFVLAADARSSSLPRVDEEGAIQVSFGVPLELSPGAVHEAGELTLALLQHPLIVSGRCLNRDGSRGAAVISVTTVEENWGDRARLWQGQPERDGSFEVRAPMPDSGEVLVSAGGFGHLGVEEQVPVGTTNLELLMVKGLTLRGRLLLPNDVPWFDMEIRMPGGRAKEIFPGGNFSVDYLREAADSWVSLECHGREIWRSEPILLEGENNNDFRPIQVQDVDLRTQLRTWHTQFVDEQGKPYGKEFRVRCFTPDEEANYVKIPEDGRFAQALSSDVDQIQIRATGAVAIELSWPPPAQVVLRKSER